MKTTFVEQSDKIKVWFFADLVQTSEELKAGQRDRQLSQVQEDFFNEAETALGESCISVELRFLPKCRECLFFKYFRQTGPLLYS